jgi:hypothetical protein
MCSLSPQRRPEPPTTRTATDGSYRFAAMQVVFVGQALDDRPQEVAFAPDSAFPTCNC